MTVCIDSKSTALRKAVLIITLGLFHNQQLQWRGFTFLKHHRVILMKKRLSGNIFKPGLAFRHTPRADQSEFVIDLELLSGFQLIYCNPLVGTTTVGILILFHIQLFFYLQSKSAREQRRSKILWPKRVQASNSDNHRPALAMAPSKCVLAPRVTSNPTFYCRGIKDPSMTSTQLISIILPSPGCAESFPTSLEQHESAFSSTLFSGLIWRCVILFHPICNLKCTLLVSAFVSLSP